jgi:hypothetical protein
MALNHYFYLSIQVKTLEEIIKAHQLHFEEIIKDNFDDDEIAGFETQLDGIAAIYAQPLLSELTFEDFYSSPVEEEDQRIFFSSCVSSIAFENMPYLEANPFQVSYLKELLTRFDEVLIDQGGVTELCFKAFACFFSLPYGWWQRWRIDLLGPKAIIDSDGGGDTAFFAFLQQNALPQGPCHPL